MSLAHGCENCLSTFAMPMKGLPHDLSSSQRGGSLISEKWEPTTPLPTTLLLPEEPANHIAHVDFGQPNLNMDPHWTAKGSLLSGRRQETVAATRLSGKVVQTFNSTQSYKLHTFVAFLLGLTPGSF